MANKPQIFIYQDYKYNNHILFKSLSSNYKSYSVEYIDSVDILKNNILESNPKVLIIPGGADLFFKEKLQGEGNKKIKQYVNEGGCYLGICAGAYYGSSFVEWAKDEKKEKEIVERRELAFFSGKAKGPVYPFLENNDISKSQLNLVGIKYGEKFSHTAKVIYWGGPILIPNQEQDNFEVLAKYEDLPEESNNAMIECYVGKGKVILCSPHFEIDAKSLSAATYKHKNPAYIRSKKIIEVTEHHENSQASFSNFLMERILGSPS